MNALLTYREAEDQELYRNSHITLGKTSITIDAATIAGSSGKPNEDAFAGATDHDTVFLAVFDGTTSLKPIAALHGQTGARFASHFLKDRSAEIDVRKTPEQVLLEFNKGLLAASTRLGGMLSDTHTLPASVGTLLRIKAGERAFSFAHTGDTFGILYYEKGRSQVFTENRNKKFDDQTLSFLAEVARANGSTPRRAREDEQVKQALINMFIARNNNPNGQGCGLINGDPNLALHIQAGSISLEGVSAILMASDGLLPPGWSLESEQDRQKLLAAIREGGFRHLFALKRQAEDADPDWNNLRYKHSDDATGLLIHVSDQDPQPDSMKLLFSKTTKKL
jgi:hypothetical protein